MSTRISSIVVLALAGCGAAPTATVAPPGERIACAHRGAPLARDCTVERGGAVFTVRHPDGAFHRLLVTPDGRNVVAADGAGYALVSTPGPDHIDVAIGGDRYRLPATIGRRAS